MFVDRDGVLNDLDYDPGEGRVSAPLSSASLRVFPYAGESIRRIRELGFSVVLVSNQPGVAKRQLTMAELRRMNGKVRRELARHGGRLDGEYYCMHHPEAVFAKYRLDCDCRKPKPGLLLRAARELGLTLRQSYFVGDSLVDVKAGRAAGCKTILVGHSTTFLAALVEKEHARPDFLVSSLRQVPDLLADTESGRSIRTA